MFVFNLMLILFGVVAGTRTAFLNKLTIFNGTVTAHMNEKCYPVQRNIPLTECLRNCGEEPKCLVTVWSPGGECKLCPFGSISLITRSDIPSIIGWRRTIENTTLSEDVNTCPASSSTRIRLPTCTEGWSLFPRYGSFFCLRIFVSSNEMTQVEAEDLCIKNGATMAGLETQSERVFALDETMKAMNTSSELARLSSKRPGWGLWIDGVRKTECAGASALFFLYCHTMEAFDFTDLQLHFKGGFSWGPGQPDGAKTLQKCIQLIVHRDVQNSNYGYLDDIDCFSLNGFFKRAVMCGKVSTAL